MGPFRRHTEGYTGQKKNALRDYKFNLTTHEYVLIKFNNDFIDVKSS